MITRALLDEKAIDWQAYMQYTQRIVDGTLKPAMYQNEKTLKYTGTNLQRMQKTLNEMTIHQKLYNLLASLQEEWLWVVISEPWCGDASWGTPALYLLSTASENIEFKILLRDDNPDVMKQYTTNGSESIPKLICIRKKDFKELGYWGPRPEPLQQIVMAYKNNPQGEFKEMVRALHQWYQDDQWNTTQDELTLLVKQWIQQP